MSVTSRQSSTTVINIPSLPSKASPNSEDQKEQSQWKPRPTCGKLTLITIILQRENHEHQERAGDELVEEHARFRHIALRVGAEDASSGSLGRRNGSATAFEGVDAVNVIDVDHAGGKEATKELCEEVEWEAAPGQFAEDAVCERYCWTMRSTVSTCFVER